MGCPEGIIGKQFSCGSTISAITGRSQSIISLITCLIALSSSHAIQRHRQPILQNRAMPAYSFQQRHHEEAPAIAYHAHTFIKDKHLHWQIMLY